MDTQCNDSLPEVHLDVNNIVFPSEKKEEEECANFKEEQDLSLTSFNKHLDEGLTIQDKTLVCIQWMDALLKQVPSVDLKLFWSIRKKAQELFQNFEEGELRTERWQRYLELTKDARQIKVLQDEEDAFVANQIELAIACLERDVQAFSDGALTSEVSKDEEATFHIASLGHHEQFYRDVRTTMIWLNSFASKVIELRKELINVGMRMRTKSQFFQRLSLVGNQIFPQKKELMRRVGQTFSEDIATFVRSNFSHKDRSVLKRMVFSLKREIKGLQKAAKLLFISSSVFAETREQLSKCWDQLKGIEGEVQQEQENLKAQSAETSKELHEAIQKVSVLFESSTDLDALRKEIAEISKSIKSAQLIHDDVIALKNALKPLQEQLKVRQDALDQQHHEQMLKELEAKKKATNDLEKQIYAFVEGCKNGQISSKDDYLALKEALVKMPFISGARKVILDNQLVLGLKYINELQEEKVLSSSEGSQTLAVQRQILAQRLERRKELKAKLDKDRQLLGGSGLDFESALQYSTIVEEDRKAIEELDKKILQLKQEMKNFL